MSELTFEPEGHIYRYDGRVVPGVTQVLEPLQFLDGVPWAVLEAAREFGTHCHIACDLWNRGELDLEALDKPLVPFLYGWIAFLSHTGFVVTASEQRVHNRKVGYAGTVDALGTWKGTSWCVDIKSGVVPPTVGLQLAAYQWATTPMPRRRLCVQLVGDGDFKLHEQKNLADFDMFKSALNIFNFRQRRKPADDHHYA